MNRYAKIGLFFTACTVLVSVYIFRSADTFTGGPTSTYYALGDNAMGLLNDSSILTAGVEVGKLKKIELENGKAKFTLDISKNLKIYSNAKLEKVMESMLGTYVLTLYPGDKSGKILKEKEYIGQVETNSGINGAMEKASEMMEKTNEVIALILKDKNQKNLDIILDSVARTAENTAQSFEGTLKLLTITLKNMAEITHKVNQRSETEMDKFSKILENTLKLTDTMNNLVDNNDKEITETLALLKDSLQSISEELKQSRGTVGDLKDISGNLSKITTKVANGEGNVGKLFNDDKLYNDISKISDKITDYAETVLGMQVHVDFHSDYMVFDKAFKTYFDVTLQPRDDRFYLFGVVDDPKGRTTETATTYEIGIDDGTSVENYVVTTNKNKKDSEFKFNLQIGRNFGPISLRGGLFQNKAGFGLDYNPWKFIALSAEIFDFGDDIPELRLKGLARPLIWAIEPFSWLYLTVGGENLINRERDLYFGFGLRFTDNDLKTIISSVPMP